MTLGPVPDISYPYVSPYCMAWADMYCRSRFRVLVPTAWAYEQLIECKRSAEAECMSSGYRMSVQYPQSGYQPVPTYRPAQPAEMQVQTGPQQTGPQLQTQTGATTGSGGASSKTLVAVLLAILIALVLAVLL